MNACVLYVNCQSYVIAAHLTPTETTLWRRVARMASTNNKMQIAVYCYNKAIRYEYPVCMCMNELSSLFSLLRVFINCA
jgi:hypothetical protein